jgi:pimeloyl-ACP methyl ester carboxylesterase
MVNFKWLAAGACLAAALGSAAAKPWVEYVPLGPANAAIYHPDGVQPHVAFVVMHRSADFMRHVACGELAARGMLAVCLDSRSVHNEATAEWDDTMLDVAQGVEYARKQPGITKIVLFGHSGGGAVMTSYQAAAEKGSTYCDAAGKISPCRADAAHLPPADALVLADAHPGDAVMRMRDFNPAVKIAADGSVHVDPSLDPFSPANGFDPKRSHYSKAFQARFLAAQAQEADTLAASARKQMDDIKAHGMTRSDEDMILVPTTNASAWLSRMDPDVEGARSTERPERLLKNDGHFVVQKITSVAVTTARGDPDKLETQAFYLGAFLSSHAIRARNSQDGIDYCSSNDSSICAVQFVSVPTMIAAMGGYLFVRDSERLYDRTASKDKEFFVLEGAVHGFTPCTACEKTPHQYDNSLKNLFDYIQSWTDKRFPG